jgi:hypothetical protein
MNRFLLCIVALTLAIVLHANARDSLDAPAGRRVLAVLDSMKIKTTHSAFFNHLKGKFTIIVYGKNEKKNERQ